MARRVVFLDIDGCLAGDIWPLADRPRRPADRGVVAQILETLHRAKISVHFLTNRPAGQLPVLAQLFGGPARYHLAESGLAAWLPDENRAAVNPAYEAFAAEVRPEVLRRLRQEIGLSWRGPVVEEFGSRLVTATIFPLGGSRADVAALVGRVRELLSDLPVDVRHGMGVDVMPAGATKACGCQWAEELHPRLHGCDLDWTAVLYVEDSTTGLEAAAYIAERGGTVAAVGDAAPEFSRAVADLGGIVCHRPAEAGVLEAILRWLA